MNSGKKVDLGNQRVVVIGGGSVAVDAARTALRLGAKEAHLVCLETRDLTSGDRMPAQDWEIEEAEDEDVIIHPCLGPKEILTEGGKVTGLETITCASVWDKEGKFAPKFAKGKAPTLEADTIIVAIGQKPEEAAFKELEKGSMQTIKADSVTLETSMKGVFAGGDVAGGPANAISAIAAGKEAATSIDLYLRGIDPREQRPAPLKKVTDVSKEGVVTKARSAMPVFRPEERKGFVEVELGFNENEAVGEAGRCLHCGCSDCLDCHKVCFYEVHSISSQGHTQQKPENCDGCGLCIEFCPCDVLALVEEEKK